ncbi:armadillo-type protein [Spinellus fusiger]|nr:armadillo-type protein [Spinellus fusiger]
MHASFSKHPHSLMTTTKYEESIKELSSLDQSKRLQALRFIKNVVIGNKNKKDLYIKLGVVEKLIDYLYLTEEEGYPLRIQAATILGSIAYGKDENAIAIVQLGALRPLLHALRLPCSVIDAVYQRRKLLEAVTRAIKAIFSSSKVSKEEFYTEDHVETVVQLLELTSAVLMDNVESSTRTDQLSLTMIAEFAAAIVARCCDTQDQQMRLAAAGVISPLVKLLYSECTKVQEAALDALTTLCRENAELGRLILQGKPNEEHLISQPRMNTTSAIMLEFVKGKSPTMRLIASTCLTNMYRTGAFSVSSHPIVLTVLPTLVRLLTEPSGDVQERAPLVLADLIKDSEDMQKAAFDADAIPRLVELLSNLPKASFCTKSTTTMIPKRKEKIRENALIAIAAATLTKEECRTQAIEAKVLSHVVSALQSDQTHVRLAACQCAKSLSRSVSNIRTSLVDAGIAGPLIKLLQDDSVTVQAAACGVVCNLCLDFSPMRKSVIEAGGIERFVEFSRCSDAKLQLNGIWALNSLLYKSDLPAKKAVMKVLTYNALIDLLHQPIPAIQEQALEIVRNLVCGNQEAIEDVIEGIGKDDLLDVIESRLQTTCAMEVDDEARVSVAATLEPALYTVVNMSSSGEEPKVALMGRPNIVNSVIRHLVRRVDD